MRRYFTLPVHIFTCLTLIGPFLSAEEVGREINWFSSGVPNYVEGKLSDAPQAFKLPKLNSARPDTAQSNLSNQSSFDVREIKIAGVTAFTVQELAELTAPFTGRSVKMEELQALRLELSQLYLQAGYINSGVIIPDQQITNGVVHLQAIEGVLTTVNIIGDIRYRDIYIESRIRRYIETPLNLKDIQKALQHLQLDDQVEHLDAKLLPGKARGESLLQVSVFERNHVSAGLSTDNYNSSSVGELRARMFVSTRNLTGFGEEVRLSASLSEGSNNFSGDIKLPLNRFNTRIQAYYARSDAKIIEQSFDVLDIKSLTDTWGFSLTQPVLESASRQLSITAGLEVKHSETELLGMPFSISQGAQDGESNTSVLQLGLDWTERGNNYVLALRGTYRKGMDRLDATIFKPQTDLDVLLNPTAADGLFDVFLFQGLFIYRLNAVPIFSALPERAQFMARTTVQLADDPLMSIAKIAIGGVNTLRGVPENLLVRDNGIAATLELQIPVPGYRADPHPLNLLFTPFIDFGQSWDEIDVEQVSSLRNTARKRHVISIGMGLIWQPVKGIHASLYYGEDIGNNFDGDDPRLLNKNNDIQNAGLHLAVTYERSF